MQAVHRITQVLALTFAFRFSLASRPFESMIPIERGCFRYANLHYRPSQRTLGGRYPVLNVAVSVGHLFGQFQHILPGFQQIDLCNDSNV